MTLCILEYIINAWSKNKDISLPMTASPEARLPGVHCALARRAKGGGHIYRVIVNKARSFTNSDSYVKIFRFP